MAHAHHHLGADKVVKAETPTASSDMNVTPLIDVLLVLLVIFMAALPLGQVGMDINLPTETRTANQTNVDVSQIMVSYTADRQLSVNQQPATMATLEDVLRGIFETRKDKKLFINGAESVRYGEIIPIIDAARGAGVEQVGIVTAGMQRAAGVNPTN